MDRRKRVKTMVLPKQNLDDKTFDQLVDEARKLIPRYSSQWTDHNLSDPGVTLIDLFAWLTEITLFRINLIRDSHKLKYLKLLGFMPQPPMPAIADISFNLKHLFNWNEIKGNDNKLLLDYLYWRYDIDWIRTAGIEKTNSDRTIIVSNPKNNISLDLDKDKNTVKLKINGITKDELIANNENGKLNIYDFSRRLTLPKGEVIQTEISGKTFSFELLERISIVPLNLEKVIVDEGTGGVFDRTGANEQADLFYAPFGLKGQENNTLYLGFDRKAEKLSFMIYLYENDLEIQPGKHGDEKGSAFNICEFTWEMSILPDGSKWQTIDPGAIIDETDGFNKSGRIIFNDLKGWLASQNSIWKEKNGRPFFWLRCILNKSGFHYPPRIEKISINTVPAIHGKTIKRDENWIRIDEFSSSNTSNGMPSQVFISPNKPILARTLVLSVSGEYKEYFANWNEIPGKDDQKLLRYLANKFYFDWIENAKIEKNPKGNIIKIFDDRNKILLLLNVWKTKVSLVMDRRKVCDFAVRVQDTDLKMYSGLWTEVDDFDGSGPEDNHYILDKEYGELKFGDGLTGRIPPDSSKISAVRYRTGGGTVGYFKPGLNWKVENEKKTVGHTLNIANHKPSTGGKDAEILKDAIERCLRDMKIPYTAVTSGDFEHIAKNTPGLRVAKAKAIPNYQKNDGDGESSSGSVTLVVLPYTPVETFTTPPSPPPGFINAICHHVDKHRLLGTQIHIESPQFIRVNVSMNIDLMKGYSENELTGTVKRELNLFLHPIKGWFDKKGWPIGRLVSRSEILEHISKIDGVNCIPKISISGDNGSTLDTNGNLKLPSEISTVYPGSMTVIINKDVNKCRSSDVHG